MTTRHGIEVYAMACFSWRNKKKAPLYKKVQYKVKWGIDQNQFGNVEYVYAV